MIVDLHTHSTFSDGVLIPSELSRRAKNAGYKGIGITDHVDISNCNHILSSILRFKDNYNKTDNGFHILAGGEITHVRPVNISDMCKMLRDNGADIVNVHGETLTEPVEPGTNIAAIKAGVDILAHPGLLTEEEGYLAAEYGVHLEITTRRGHSYANGHIANIARKTGAILVVNNDAHAPGDFVGEGFALKILQGAGLTFEEAVATVENTVRLFEKKSGIKFNE